jgi:hypothetical protein
VKTVSAPEGEEWSKYNEMIVHLLNYGTKYVAMSSKEKSNIVWVPTSALLKYIIPHADDVKREDSYVEAMWTWFKSHPLDVCMEQVGDERTVQAAGALGIVEVNTGDCVARLADGRLRVQIAHELGVRLFPVKFVAKSIPKTTGTKGWKHVVHLSKYRLLSSVDITIPSALINGTYTASRTREARLREISRDGLDVVRRNTRSTTEYLSYSDDDIAYVEEVLGVNDWLNWSDLTAMGVMFGLDTLFERVVAKDELVQLVMDSQRDGYWRRCVVNTQNRNRGGVHWVTVYYRLRRATKGAEAIVVDTLRSNGHSVSVHKLLCDGNVTVPDGVIVLGWQKDGWSCGYLSFYLAAPPFTCNADFAGSVEALKKHCKKMPPWFPEVVRCLVMAERRHRRGAAIVLTQSQVEAIFAHDSSVVNELLLQWPL